MLRGLLDWHRSTLLFKCAGLSGEQPAQAPIAQSNLPLLGLIRHLVQQTHFVTLADPGLREDGHRVIISDLWRQLKIVRWPRACRRSQSESAGRIAARPKSMMLMRPS
jgi:hypothetical protein